MGNSDGRCLRRGKEGERNTEDMMSKFRDDYMCEDALFYRDADDLSAGTV